MHTVEALGERHVPIHPFHSLPTPHSVQQHYSTNSIISCTHMKLQLSTLLIIIIRALSPPY